MNYYWFNRQEMFQKAKENTQKKKLLSIINKKEAIKEKSKKCYKNLSQEEKDNMKEYQKKNNQELVQYKKK